MTKSQILCCFFLKMAETIFDVQNLENSSKHGQQGDFQEESVNYETCLNNLLSSLKGTSLENFQINPNLRFCDEEFEKFHREFSAINFERSKSERCARSYENSSAIVTGPALPLLYVWGS